MGRIGKKRVTPFRSRLEAWKKRFHDMSLKNALMVYIILGTAATLFAIVFIISICQNVEYRIWGRYADYWLLDRSFLTGSEQSTMETIDFLETWIPLLCPLAGVLAVSWLFYRNRLKRPLAILSDSAARIAENDLDFQCRYDRNDELGQLCAGFEKMRAGLSENNKKMWGMMEEQKRLNHAFAHDLRTPLTVLHGYIGFLEKYYPEGRVSEEKLMETLGMMDRQVERLRRFGDTMKSVNTLEERQAAPERHTAAEIMEALEELAEGLDGKNGIRIWTECRIGPGKELFLDEALFCEVAGNLFSNGIRYAKGWLQVILTESAGYLELYVRDDGPGFSPEGLKMAARPYYKEKSEGTEHFGIGLYICRILCEKHGGSLTLHNSVDGGALVSAFFKILPVEKK